MPLDPLVRELPPAVRAVQDDLVSNRRNHTSGAGFRLFDTDLVPLVCTGGGVPVSEQRDLVAIGSYGPGLQVGMFSRGEQLDPAAPRPPGSRVRIRVLTSRDGPGYEQLELATEVDRSRLVTVITVTVVGSPWSDVPDPRSSSVVSE